MGHRRIHYLFLSLCLVLLGAVGIAGCGSPPDQRDFGGSSTPDLAPIGNLTHRFIISWAIVDGRWPDPKQAPLLACGQVGVFSVGVTYKHVTTSVGDATTFPCTPSGRVMSTPLPDGNYILAVALLGPENRIITNTNNTFTMSGGDIDLGTAYFPFQP